MSHSTTNEDNLQLVVRPQPQTPSGDFLVNSISSGALGIQTFIFAIFATLVLCFGLSGQNTAHGPESQGSQVQCSDDERNDLVIALQREVQQLRQTLDARDLEIEKTRSERDSIQETADRQGAMIPQLVSEVAGYNIILRTREERLAKLEDTDQAQRSQISGLQADIELLRKELHNSKTLGTTLQAQNQLLTAKNLEMKETLIRQTDEMIAQRTSDNKALQDVEMDRKALQEKVNIFSASSNEFYLEKSTISTQLTSTILELSNTQSALSDSTVHLKDIGAELIKLLAAMNSSNRSITMDSEVLDDEHAMVALTLTNSHNKGSVAVGRGTSKDTSRAEKIAIITLACDFVENAHKFPFWPWVLDQPSSKPFKFGSIATG